MNKKRTVSVLMASMILFSGCSNGNPSKQSTTSDSSQESSVVSVNSHEEPSSTVSSKEAYAVDAVEALLSSLKHPDTLKVYGIYTLSTSNTIYIDYEAANDVGGMKRSTIAYDINEELYEPSVTVTVGFIELDTKKIMERVKQRNTDQGGITLND
jgi:hypothetical protein